MEQKALDILIVDDNQQDCLYLQKVIESTTSTTNVIIANTIAEAIGLCNNHNFDCIFLKNFKIFIDS